MGRALAGTLGPLRAGPLWAALGTCGPGPCGPALWALLGPPGPLWDPPGPCGHPWALLGSPGLLWAGQWALVGRALWATCALVGPPGPLWAGPLWPPLGPYGPGPCGRSWALMGRALMGPPDIRLYIYIYIFYITRNHTKLRLGEGDVAFSHCT